MGSMKLSKHDLNQFDRKYLNSLTHDQLLALSEKILSDLKDLHDRLGQNSGNSSIPSGALSPWINAKPGTTPLKNLDQEEEDGDDPIVDIDSGVDSISPGPTSNEPSEKEADAKNKNSGDSSAESGAIATGSNAATDGCSITGCADTSASTSPQKKMKPGKQAGTQGFGRTQTLPITCEVVHRTTCCSGCNCALDVNASFEPKTGHYIIDVQETASDCGGLILTNIKHIYGDTLCPSCGHSTRIFPARCEAEEGWKVELTEWHLCGPRLVSLICSLALRHRLSRMKIQEFLWDWVGLSLSIGTINQCIHEAGRAVAPLEAELQKIVQEAVLLHVDETSWKVAGKPFWLWVFVAVNAVYFTVGSRGGEVLSKVIGAFSGWLMSDGYTTYRSLKKRLRCWAHLIRKATGVSESLDKEARCFGQKVLAIMDSLTQAIYKAREGPPRDITEENKPLIMELYMLLLKHEDSQHEKTRALAGEFLNDWDAIFTILKHPEMPLTNNEAETALRHWVIARRISHGTRTCEGTTAFTLLASVIETCRKRKISPWPYLASVIKARRQGHLVPCLPQPT